MGIFTKNKPKGSSVRVAVFCRDTSDGLQNDINKFLEEHKLAAGEVGVKFTTHFDPVNDIDVFNAMVLYLK